MANIVACCNNEPIQSQISRQIVQRCTIHGTGLPLFIYVTALRVIKNYIQLKHKLCHETKKNRVDIIKVFYLPTDVQSSYFKRILKFTLK